MAQSQKETKVSNTLSLPLRVADLPGRGVQGFSLSPEAPARAELAKRLRIEKVRKLTFDGEIRPQGGQDWVLTGELRATVVQACVVSGEPVSTRIEVPVSRIYLRDMPEPTEAETEMPEDETLEPLRATIDPGDVMAEALALELPDYPRATGATLDGIEGLARDPLPDERPNPFAALAKLKPGSDGA